MARWLTGENPIPRTPPARRSVNNGWAGWVRPGQHVLIQSWTGRLAVTPILLSAVAGAGDGVWEEIDRPPTAPGSLWGKPQTGNLTEFKGRSNKHLALKVLIEGWPTRKGGQRDVESQIRTIEEMCDAGIHVRVIGPVPFWGRRYGINTVTYDTDPPVERARRTGRRIRQALTLDLVELILPEGAAALTRGRATPKSTQHYTITTGDDLRIIAAKTLANAARWPEIAALNPPMRGVRLDDRRWRPGVTIRVPKQ